MPSLRQPEYGRQQSDFSSKSGLSSGSQYGQGHVLPSHRSQRAGGAGGAGGPPAITNGQQQRQQHASRAAGGPEASSSAVKRNLTRAKTLTRPDRHITPAPLINPHKAPGAAAANGGVLSSSREKPSWWQPWTFYINVVTFWAPAPLLSACGMKERAKQRAWKEKVALCSIAIVMGAFVGFATIGLNRTLCPDDQGSTPEEFIRLGDQSGASLESTTRLCIRLT